MLNFFPAKLKTGVFVQRLIKNFNTLSAHEHGAFFHGPDDCAHGGHVRRYVRVCDHRWLSGDCGHGCAHGYGHARERVRGDGCEPCRHENGRVHGHACARVGVDVCVCGRLPFFCFLLGYHG
jgi:hypothetical protein